MSLVILDHHHLGSSIRVWLDEESEITTLRQYCEYSSEFGLKHVIIDLRPCSTFTNNIVSIELANKTIVMVHSREMFIK